MQSPERRRAERVRALLAGELLEPGELNYDLEACHLGAIAAGPEAEKALRDLATALDRRLLAIKAGEGTTWAWLGGRERMNLEETLEHTGFQLPQGVCLALGEPAQGIDGWRHSHRQAKAALPVARRKQGLVRYAEVSLLVSMLQDDVLTRSLRELYLAPLTKQRDGGEALLETLRTYFAVERNISSAAAALGVSRKTVNKRLRLAEELLGQPLGCYAAELEAALRLREEGALVVDLQEPGGGNSRPVPD